MQNNRSAQQLVSPRRAWSKIHGAAYSSALSIKGLTEEIVPLEDRGNLIRNYLLVLAWAPKCIAPNCFLPILSQFGQVNLGNLSSFTTIANGINETLACGIICQGIPIEWKACVIRHCNSHSIFMRARFELISSQMVDSTRVWNQDYLGAVQHQDSGRFGELAVITYHAPNFNRADLGVQSTDRKIVPRRKRSFGRKKVTSVNFRIRQHNLSRARDERNRISWSAVPLLQISHSDCDTQFSSQRSEVADIVAFFADGTLTGDLSYTFTGGDAAGLRGSLKEQGAKEVQKGWDQSLGTVLPGLSVNGFEFHITPGLDTPLNMDFHLSVPDYGREAGPLLLVRPRVLGSDARLVPGLMGGEARKYPIELAHPGIWTDDYDIKLPPGFRVDEAAAPVKVDFPFGSYHSSVATKGGMLHFEREYVVKQVEVPAAQAAEFRKLEDAIITDEKGMAVLKKEQRRTWEGGTGNIFRWWRVGSAQRPLVAFRWQRFSDFRKRYPWGRPKQHSGLGRTQEADSFAP